MLTPGAPEQHPGLERFPQFAAYSTAGPSPRTWNVQLPGYGSWLLNMSAWHGNQNKIILRQFIVTWFRYGAGTNTVAGATPITPATIGTGADPNLLTDLMVAAPTVAGLVEVSAAFSGGGSMTVRLIVTGHRLMQPAEFTG